MSFSSPHYHREIMESVLDPEWSCCSYINGYFYFRSKDHEENAVMIGLVPIGVRKELGKRACYRMRHISNLRGSERTTEDILTDIKEVMRDQTNSVKRINSDGESPCRSD